MSRYTPPGSRPRGSCLPWVVGFVLLAAAGAAAFLVTEADDRERADYRRAVELEAWHPVAVKNYEFARDVDRKYGDPKGLDAARKDLAKIRAEYTDLIARYPRWGKTALEANR